MSEHINISEIRSLTVEERLVLIDQIWDTIAAQPNSVEVSEAQRAELDRRLARYEASPDEGNSWDDVKARLDRGS